LSATLPQQPKARFAHKGQVVLICFLSALILFPSFYKNSWGLVDRRTFLDFQRDLENLVLGRMVESRQKGIFSDGALLGRGPIDPYVAFGDRVPFPYYITYNSQIGAQGILFGTLDRLTPFLLAYQKVALFRVLASLLSVTMLTLIVLWFYREHGLTVALFVLGSAVLSSWLTLFGKTMWWSLWAFYLPMAAMMLCLGRSRPALWRIGSLAFATVFVKCLFNGYEYITTTLVMMVVPIFYYGIVYRWRLRGWMASLSAASAAACLAILLSFVVLCLQIAAVKGHFSDGVSHIVASFAKRSHGNPANFDPKLSDSLNAKTADVVRTYLNGSFCGIKWLPTATYSRLIGLFLAATGIACFCGQRALDENSRRKAVALLCATWISICAPLSWFIVFKAHSQIHTHMNFIVWQMPFTLFGFAVCGLLASRLVSSCRRRCATLMRAAEEP